ncbi:AraC family transcriptional regulator [Ulvibacterium sp.]|uniref:helix-turn-helix domain-containing protein n=1 Tax=Ulvibacterium sp. TaxID=2665914 RepID=UPI00260A11BD|nr:helix-turn-helix domain-containing protein [Ulvibacterium sp.]
MNAITIDGFGQLHKLLRLPEKELNENFFIFRMDEIHNKNKAINTPYYRQNFFEISLFLEINFELKYSYLDFQVSNNTIQICPPRQVQKVFARPEELKRARGYTFYFKQELLGLRFNNGTFLAEFPFFAYNSLDNVFEISHVETIQLIEIFERIIYEQSNKASTYKEMIKAYSMALLYKLMSLWEERRNPIETTYSNKESLIVSSFDNLVSQNIGTIQKVSDFADMLHMSPKHLSEILKRNTGKTAKQLIDEAIALEAKILLKSEHLSISEVSYRLGFEDSSNFATFFKRVTGMVPSNFV